MPSTLASPPTRKAALVRYSELKKRVRAEIAHGKERALRAVEREKVRTSWHVGKLILNHILLNKKRGTYGESVLKRLSKDIGVSYTELAYMVEFARTYPKFRTSGDLSWGHYQSLLRINDKDKRNQLAKLAASNAWPIKRLRSEIRKLKRRSSIKSFEDDSGSVIPAKAGTSVLKRVTPGPLNVFRKRIVGGRELIDLGFSTYLEKKNVKKKLKFVKDRRFTYQAEVERVVDGDTLWAVVDLGLGVKTRQKLRLRGLDAPELKSRSGQRAKKYLAKLLRRSTYNLRSTTYSLLISTTKSDKFDRYLVDVWVGKEYINQTLIEKGYANAV